MKRSLAVFGVVVTCALGAPAPSQACLHVIEFTKHDAVAAVARADRLLARGDARRAYRVARRARRRLERDQRQNGRDADTRRVLERARHLTAIAVVRLDGHTPVSHRTARRHVMRGRSQRSLAWAREQLRARAESNPGDLSAQVHYAEALARLPDSRAEARRILSRLADRDLMPDAHGYATLLRLLEPGSASWNQALTRCQRIAADHADSVCPSGSPASAPAS